MSEADTTATDLADLLTAENPIWKVLEPIYDEMRSRNQITIKEGQQMRSDEFFCEKRSRTDDDRRCLAVSAIIDDKVHCEWSSSFAALQNELTTDFPNDLHFGQSTSEEIHGQLHWTLIQLVGFADFEAEVQRENSPYAGVEYLDCVEKSLADGGLDAELRIHFIGVIAVSTGLLMIGVPERVDMNQARDHLRQQLNENGLPIKEPFCNDIVHCTLFRVLKDEPLLYQRMLDIADRYKSAYLGNCVLNRFRVGPASWRMCPTKDDLNPWRSWVLRNKA